MKPSNHLQLPEPTRVAHHVVRLLPKREPIPILYLKPLASQNRVEVDGLRHAAERAGVQIITGVW